MRAIGLFEKISLSPLLIYREWVCLESLKCRNSDSTSSSSWYQNYFYTLHMQYDDDEDGNSQLNDMNWPVDRDTHAHTSWVDDSFELIKFNKNKSELLLFIRILRKLFMVCCRGQFHCSLFQFFFSFSCSFWILHICLCLTFVKRSLGSSCSSFVFVLFYSFSRLKTFESCFVCFLIYLLTASTMTKSTLTSAHKYKHTHNGLDI